MKRIDQADDETLRPEPTCSLLVVAGRPLSGQGLEAMFRQAGCCGSVYAERCPERALARMPQIEPDVVLIDLQLSRCDAFEVARSIRVSRPNVRLIFLDDSLHKGRLQAVLKFSGAGYFTQEDSFEALQEAVLAVASGRCAFSEAAARHIDQSNGRPRWRDSGGRAGFGQLTRRQLEVMTLLAQGLTVKQCARQLGISPSTVDNHKSRLMARLNVHKAVDLVRVAIQEGLLERRCSAPGEERTAAEDRHW